MSPGAGDAPAGRAIAGRLTVAFVGVTLLAVAIVANLELLLGKQRIDTMVKDRRIDHIRSMEANGVATYNSGEHA